MTYAIFFLPRVGSLILAHWWFCFLWEICVLRWWWACLFRRSAKQVSSQVFIVTFFEIFLSLYTVRNLYTNLYISIHLLIKMFWLTDAHPYHLIFLLFPPLLFPFESGLDLVTFSKKLISKWYSIDVVSHSQWIYTQKNKNKHIYKKWSKIQHIAHI